MINNHNSFIGIFVAGLALAAFGSNAFAYTQMGLSTPIGNNTTIQNAIYSTATSNATNGSEFKICPENHYVAQCGSYRVGFNWLKSATLPVQVTGQTERITVKTNNYYVGDTTLELFEQMRTFFGHNDNINISYKDDNDNLQTIDANCNTGYCADRELILKNLCHPASTSYKCVKCPNNANVAASVVKLDDDGLTVTESWKFYTIADCYIKEFEDQSGVFFFVPDAIVDPSELNADDGAECYYTNTDTNALSDLNGDEIGNFIPGLNSSRTLLEFNSSASEIRQFVSH